jgi:hypothetical protein
MKYAGCPVFVHLQAKFCPPQYLDIPLLIAYFPFSIYLDVVTKAKLLYLLLLIITLVVIVVVVIVFQSRINNIHS